LAQDRIDEPAGADQQGDLGWAIAERRHLSEESIAAIDNSLYESQRSMRGLSERAAAVDLTARGRAASVILSRS
jgi:hypothetical protein